MNSINQPLKDNPEAGEKPKSPRALLAAVIIMGVLLVVGFIVVISTIIYRVSNAGSVKTQQAFVAPGAPIETLIPDDFHIRAMELSSSHLVVHIAPKTGGKGEIIIYDLKRGAAQTRIILKTQ